MDNKECKQVCVCTCAYTSVRERVAAAWKRMRMTEREAEEIDRGVSERCNYSSRQGEGEITTHSMLHTTPRLAPASVRPYILYAFRLQVSSCLRSDTLAQRLNMWEGKKKKKMSSCIDSGLISIITTGYTHTHTLKNMYALHF